MNKHWDIEKELETKTIKKLSKEMFDYYKKDVKELLKFVNATNSQILKWTDAYFANLEIEQEHRGLIKTNVDKAQHKVLIYKELYTELTNLMSNIL